MKHGNRKVAVTGVALSDCGRVDDATPYALHAQAARRAVADAGLDRALVDGFASAGLGTLAPVEVAEYLGLRPTWVDSTSVGGSTWEVMAAHAADAIAAGHARVVLLAYGSTARAGVRAGPRPRTLSFGTRGPLQFEAPLRPHRDRQVRHGCPPPHDRVRHDDRAVGSGGGPGPGQRGPEPGGDVPHPRHGGRDPGRPDDRRPLHQAALLRPFRRRG